MRVIKTDVWHMATDGSLHLKELLGIGWFSFLNFHHIKRIEEEIGHYRHN